MVSICSLVQCSVAEREGGELAQLLQLVSSNFAAAAEQCTCITRKPSTSMFLTMFFETQNIGHTMLIAHP